MCSGIDKWEKVMKNEKSANDAVISILVLCYKNKKKLFCLFSFLFFFWAFFLLFLRAFIPSIRFSVIFGAIQTGKSLMNEFEVATVKRTKWIVWCIPRHSVDPIINHWIIWYDSNFATQFQSIPMHLCTAFSMQKKTYSDDIAFSFEWCNYQRCYKWHQSPDYNQIFSWHNDCAAQMFSFEFLQRVLFISSSILKVVEWSAGII